MLDYFGLTKTRVLAKIIKQYNIKTFCEIGVWRGYNLFKLASKFPNVKFVGVDPYLNSNYNLLPQEGKFLGNLEQLYYKIIRKSRNYPNLSIYRTSSEKASKMFGTFDMVFIDAFHMKSAVNHDINLWKDKALKVLCGHDFTTCHFGVVLAVVSALPHFEVRGNGVWIMPKVLPEAIK